MSTGLFSDIDDLLEDTKPTAPTEPLPSHLEAAVRTFLTCATYQAERPFFRHGHPIRFVPKDEALGVTMSILCREQVFEVGLFGTEAICRSLASILTSLPDLSLAACADALGEQMNLISGKLSYQELSLTGHSDAVQLGLPNTYLNEQCATYRTLVIPQFAQQISCEGLGGAVWLTAAERSPYYLMGEALALLESGTNRIVLSSVIALLDEFRELDDREEREELKLVEYCKTNLVKRINDGPGNLDNIVSILERVRSARAPFEGGGIPETGDDNAEILSVEPDDLELLMEFVSEGREAVDAIDGIMMLAERNGASSENVGQLFRLFHSLKGTAGMLGVRPVTAIAHGTETMLSDVRDHGRRFDKRLVDFVFASSSLIRRQVELTFEATRNHGRLQLVPGFQEHSDGLKLLHEGGEPDCIDVGSLIDASAGAAAGPAKSESVRVDVATVERVVALLRGLTLVKNQIRDDVDTATENLTRVQDKLIQLGNEMSLVSCEKICNKTSRLVRDLSRSLGKMVEVSFEGAEYRVSRSILEAISDPLTHVLRNSLDHGIETPDERRETDKPALARVFVQLDFEDDTLVVNLGDDGRGINGDKILEVAKKKGVVADDAELSWDEKCALIFSPGFSTAEEVSDISGRGVGLDVVKRTLEELGGKLELTSELGRGTTFTFRIPMNSELTSGGFSDSLEVLLMDDAAQQDLATGEVGWF